MSKQRRFLEDERRFNEKKSELRKEGKIMVLPLEIKEKNLTGLNEYHVKSFKKFISEFSKEGFCDFSTIECVMMSIFYIEEKGEKIHYEVLKREKGYRVFFKRLI